MSRAKSQKLGLAWPGFGPGQAFLLIYNFAGFHYEINVKNNFIPTLTDSFLSAGHPKSCKKTCKIAMNCTNGGFDCDFNFDGSH